MSSAARRSARPVRHKLLPRATQARAHRTGRALEPPALRYGSYIVRAGAAARAAPAKGRFERSRRRPRAGHRCNRSTPRSPSYPAACSASASLRRRGLEARLPEPTMQTLRGIDRSPRRGGGERLELDGLLQLHRDTAGTQRLAEIEGAGSGHALVDGEMHGAIDPMVGEDVRVGRRDVDRILAGGQLAGLRA